MCSQRPMVQADPPLLEAAVPNSLPMLQKWRQGFENNNTEALQFQWLQSPLLKTGGRAQLTTMRSVRVVYAGFLHPGSLHLKIHLAHSLSLTCLVVHSFVKRPHPSWLALAECTLYMYTELSSRSPDPVMLSSA